MRIADVASMVKSKIDHVSLLLWNTNLDQACESNLCCGPMPMNYEKLAATVQTILTAIECPVCFNTIPSPFTQCQNGHLLCLKCRARSDRCPICRDRYSVVRCLLAEQVIIMFDEERRIVLKLLEATKQFDKKTKIAFSFKVHGSFFSISKIVQNFYFLTVFGLKPNCSTNCSWTQWSQ